MRNPISLLRSMLQWFRPTRRVQCNPPLSNPSRAKEQADEALTPEKFREMFAGMLADPETRSTIMRSLVPYFPIEGGTTACPSVTSIVGGTANYIPMLTSMCNIENSNIYQLSNKVGIGITAPQGPLHVLGTNSAASGDAKYTIAAVDSTTYGAGVGGGILFSGYYNATSRADFANIRGVKENGTSGDYASALIFDTRINGGNQTERMRITSVGNVAIGNTNPQAKLDITGGMNASGSAVLGGTATKQSANGPEKLSVQDATATNVAIGVFVVSDPNPLNARFLLDMNGNHEWSNDGTDQTVVLGCIDKGRMNLVGFPKGAAAGGGLGIVAWKWSTLYPMGVDGTTMTFPVQDTVPFSVNGRIRVDDEICTINSIGVGTLNVNRHQEGTMAVSHSVNAPVVAIGTEEAQPRILFLNDGGGIAFSDGINATDVTLSRPVANQILLQGNLATGRANISLANGDNNDVDLLGATFVKVTVPTAAFAVTGFAGGSDGRILLLYNTTSETMTIKYNNTGSAAANRILTLTGADISLRANGPSFATFIYDVDQSRWILTATN